MKIYLPLALALSLTASALVSADEAKPKTQPARHGDLTLQVPEDWKVSPSASRMRLATYEIPAAEGDSEAGELSISSFPGGGGGVDPNLQRWIGQFDGAGREAKATQGTAGENQYYVVDVAGTYKKPDGPPILGRTKPVEGYRMLGVILLLKGKGVYFLKLTGPDKTVKAQSDSLRTAFGGSAEAEKEYEF